MIDISERERNIVLKGIIDKLCDGWEFAMQKGAVGTDLTEMENQLVVDILMEYAVGGENNG